MRVFDDPKNVPERISYRRHLDAISNILDRFLDFSSKAFEPLHGRLPPWRPPPPSGARSLIFAPGFRARPRAAAAFAPPGGARGPPAPAAPSGIKPSSNPPTE